MEDTMKKQYLAMALGLMIAVSQASVYAEEGNSEVQTEMAGAAQDGTSEEAGDDEAAETVTGQITEIGNDSITIETGMGGGQMQGDMPGAGEQPQGDAAGAENQSQEAADGAEDQSQKDAAGAEEQSQGDAPAQMEVSEGETVTIQITDETQILKQSMGMQGGQSGSMGEAPEKPDGEAADGQQDGEVPEMPSGDGAEAPSGDMNGEAADGEVPEMPSGDMGGQPGGDMSATEAITLADLEVGDMVTVVLNEDGSAATITVQSMGQGAGGMAPGNGGMGQSGVDSYDAVQTISEDTELDDETVASTGTDENAILVDSDVTATLSDMTISRDSADSTGGDNSSFYGVGAAVLATDGTVYVDDSTITTDASGGAGIFAYGDSTVYVSDTDITTQQDTSGGIHAAGGGTLYAWDVTAETNGRSAAAVRSDRGGGLMVVDGGTYTSNGSDSPAVYCTADISIHDAELTANSSEAVCIEGLNTLRLYDCDLTGTMSDDDRNDNTWTVIVYQSMSGDSEVGNGTFQMEDGTLTAAGSGGLFYTTNTECTITLKDVEIVKPDASTFFLQCTGNTNSRGWGQTGRNGSDCLFTAISQEMQGDVIWDSISNLEFYMTDGSTLTGAFVNDETYAGEGGDGVCNVYISEDSTWIVTGDSTVSVLNSEGTIMDEDGNTVTVQGEDGTVYVEGDSAYTVTVEGYSDSVKLSGCAQVDDWEDHAVEMPEQL
jgi:hypothetical protein